MKKVILPIVLLVAVVSLSGCINFGSQSRSYCGSAEIASMLPTPSEMQRLQCNYPNESECETACRNSESNIRSQYQNVDSFSGGYYQFDSKDVCNDTRHDCGNSVVVIKFESESDARKAVDSMKSYFTEEGFQEPHSEMVGMNKTYIKLDYSTYKTVMWRSSEYLVTVNSMNYNVATINQELKLALLSEFPCNLE